MNEIKETDNVMVIPKEVFSDCFKKWKSRCDACVSPKGSTLKGTRPSSFPVLYPMNVIYLLIASGWLLSGQTS